jgi:tetrahydromethanopterin S-methyltransferase subunit G
MERLIKIEVIISEEEIKQLFEDREIKYKKKYFDEIEEHVSYDYSELEEALGEMVDNFIADNYEE